MRFVTFSGVCGILWFIIGEYVEYLDIIIILVLIYRDLVFSFIVWCEVKDGVVICRSKERLWRLRYGEGGVRS